MVVVGKSRLYKNNQTTVPSIIRKELNIKQDSIINWELNSDNSVTIKINDEKTTLRDLAGIGKSNEKTNAVELKRGLYK